MKTSRAGIDLIKRWEGCKLTAYQDGAGIWTIGWGTTTAAGHGTIAKGMKITQALADEWLIDSLPKYEAVVLRALKRIPSQPQFDALVSLAYNVPKAFPDSTVIREFNAGRYTKAATGFLLWNKVRNPRTGALEFSQGLHNRRSDEMKLFLTDATAPNLPVQPDPVPPVPDVPDSHEVAGEAPRGFWAWLLAMVGRK